MRIMYVLMAALFLLSCDERGSFRFNVSDFPEEHNDRMGIRGNTAPLSWDKTIFLKNGTLDGIVFDSSVRTIEYKYVIDFGDSIVWENIPNRMVDISKTRNVLNFWNVEDPIDVTKLEKITSNQLLQDFDLIKTMILDVHPGTYRYNDSTTIHNALAKLHDFFGQERSRGEAYLAISEMTAKLQCDHTKAGFNNQSRVIDAIIHQQEDKLPFTFKWIDDKMIVDYNASDEKEIKRGDRILSLHGKDVLWIREQLMPYVGADGATDQNRIRKLEVDGLDFRYNAFDIFYPLKFPIVDKKIKVEVEHQDGTIQGYSVSTLSRKQRIVRLTQRYNEFPKSRDDFWKFQILDFNTAILTANSFGLNGWKAMTLDYKQFLREKFDLLKQKEINHLIIDIRRNTGGNDEMKKELFRYLQFDRSLAKQPIREGRTRYLEFPDQLKPYIKTWGNNPWYYNLEDSDRTDRENGYFIFEENPERIVPEPARENSFSGEVYLLCSASNTSLAFYTVRDFKRFKIGKIYGEETGGNLRDLNGGQILFLTLPNSEIEIDFPVMGGFTKKEVPNSGVLPDYSIKREISDIQEDRDGVLIEVLKRIKNGE